MIGRNAILQTLFGNGWVALMAVDPETGRQLRRDRSGQWRPIGETRPGGAAGAGGDGGWHRWNGRDRPRDGGGDGMTPGDDELVFHDLKKIEIIVKGDRQAFVSDLLDRSGTTGYTLIRNIAGMGHHGFQEGRLLFNDRATPGDVFLAVATDDAIRKDRVGPEGRSWRKNSGVMFRQRHQGGAAGAFRPRGCRHRGRGRLNHRCQRHCLAGRGASRVCQPVVRKKSRRPERSGAAGSVRGEGPGRAGRCARADGYCVVAACWSDPCWSGPGANSPGKSSTMFVPNSGL